MGKRKEKRRKGERRGWRVEEEERLKREDKSERKEKNGRE